MDISKFISEFLLENETDFHKIKELRLIKLKGFWYKKRKDFFCSNTVTLNAREGDWGSEVL